MEPRLLAEDARCSPTFSWWALKTPMIRARLRSGTEAKRGALRRVLRDRGGDRADPAATGVFNAKPGPTYGYPNLERRLRQVQARSKVKLPRKGRQDGTKVEATS